MRYKCLTYQECIKEEWQNCAKQLIEEIDKSYGFIVNKETHKDSVRFLLPEYISKDTETKEEFEERMMKALGQRLKYGVVAD